MFGRKRRGADLRTVTQQQFVSEVTTGIRSQRNLTHLYLMLEEGGSIGVQWETPSGDQLRRFHVVERDRPGCPHCAVLAGIEALRYELPLDGLRAARARDQYLLLLRMGRLPCPAFATEPDRASALGRIIPVRPSSGWLADTHSAEGNPHSDADCARHRA